MRTRTVTFNGLRIDGRDLAPRRGELTLTQHESDAGDGLKEWVARADLAGHPQIPENGHAEFDTDEGLAEGEVILTYGEVTADGASCQFQGSGALTGLRWP